MQQVDIDKLAEMERPVPESIGTRKYRMFGGSASRTLDELVEYIVPKFTKGTKRRKMSRYQTLYYAFRKMWAGLGDGLMSPEAHYVVCRAMERAARLNDALIGEPDEDDL